MTRPIDLMRAGRKEELWKMCCGFLNLSLEEFMTIQKRLLQEQIELLKGCQMGRRLMGGAMPETIKEFREQVPLTTYSDYLPELADKEEDVLPAMPVTWLHNIGWPGKYMVKRMPISERFLEEFERVAAGVGLIASCDSRGRFPMKRHLKVLLTMGSRHYGLGMMGHSMQRALGYDLLPSNADEIPFHQKMREGFRKGMWQDLEGAGGLSSVLLYVGEMFRQGVLNHHEPGFLLSHPRALARWMKGSLKSRLAGRTMLPKDLWSLKAVIGGGTDGALFADRIEELWGRRPLEIYAGTEGGIYATQTWDYEGLTFVPNLNFFEFIPESEWFRWQMDNSYRPRTVLLDDVEVGKVYEVVITNFHGGIMTRYRPGDMVRITSLRNDRLDIATPQMVFERRADELIIMFGLGHVTEKVIDEAIENSGIPCVGWTARKEVVDSKPALRIYLEVEDNYIASEQNIAAAVYQEMSKLEGVYHFNLQRHVYGDAPKVMGLKPVVVSLLPRGAFASYIAERRLQGVNGDDARPQHINAPETVLSSLKSPKVVVEAVPAGEGERAAVG